MLLPDESKSYVAEHHVSENDVFDNRLIFGDNLLALKALEGELSRKSSMCIYIDPPFNTDQAPLNIMKMASSTLNGLAFLMRERIEILHRLLLIRDGSMFCCHIDDNELGHYLNSPGR